MGNSRLIKMILCPVHEEDTPSCGIYSDGHYHCYGCHHSGNVTELGMEISNEKSKPKPAEAIAETLSYIKTLDQKLIRGVLLPVDDSCYYIVWPSGDYYIARYHVPTIGKYRNPTGYRKPPYIAGNCATRSDGIVVVEGELNAVSIHQAVPEILVISPGSASDLATPLAMYDNFDKILILADEDKAGAIGAIQLASNLGRKKDVRIKLMKEDANDMLIKYGKERLKEFITQALHG